MNVCFHTSILGLNLILPLGISFFTFQQIAFLVDVHGEKGYKNFLDYSLFVSFFPQLIAGPIVHHKAIIPQFKCLQNKRFSYENFACGIFIFAIGLFKKVIIADSLAPVVDAGFGQNTPLTTVSAWWTTLAYSIQIYNDFSGYCDMAIGIGLMFNIKLPINFNSPYKAHSVQEFWRRWHITLSRFMMDYIYIPLGGNRRGEKRTYLNLLIVFFVSGLWHGANWTFVIWGMIHGCAILINRVLDKSKIKKLPVYLAWPLTFAFVNISWVFFRADSLNSALKIIASMFGLNQNIPTIANDAIGKNAITLVLLSLFAAIFFYNSNQLRIRFAARKWEVALTIILLLISICFLSRPSSFIYFNF